MVVFDLFGLNCRPVTVLSILLELVSKQSEKRLTLRNLEVSCMLSFLTVPGFWKCAAQHHDGEIL